MNLQCHLSSPSGSITPLVLSNKLNIKYKTQVDNNNLNFLIISQKEKNCFADFLNNIIFS